MKLLINHNFKLFLHKPKSITMADVCLDDTNKSLEIYNIVSGDIEEILKVSHLKFKGSYHFNMLENVLYLRYVCEENDNLKIIFIFDLYREQGKFANVPLAINCIEYEKIFSREEKEIPPTYDTDLKIKLKLLNISIQGDENNYSFYLNLIKGLMSTILKTEYNEGIKDAILRTTTIDKKMVSECKKEDKITELIFNNDYHIIDSVWLGRLL